MGNTQRFDLANAVAAFFRARRAHERIPGWRRARYLRPLQLYLVASVIVFAAVQIFGLDASLRFYGEHGIHLLRAAPLSADESASRGVRLTPVQIIVDHILIATPRSRQEIRRGNAADKPSYQTARG